MLPIRVPATGNVTPWQEASVGAAADGLRLTEVRVNVGDTVTRGQLLARFNADIIEAELDEARAAVAQAEAEVMEAEANAGRAKDLDGSGAISAQQVDQYILRAITTRARLQAMRAVARKSGLRRAQARVLAPSDGIITSRSATIGAVVPAGQELFRLIKDGRLEWRAAVATADLAKLAPGQIARLRIDGQETIEGELRMIAPAIDPETLTGLVYVDLPREAAIRAGAFARGHFEIGGSPALTVPQAAVVLRDGFSYVMRIGPKSDIVLTKVRVGRRTDDRIEITEGLTAAETIVASGLSFLGEGDTVRVVNELLHDSARQPTPSVPAASTSDAFVGSAR